MKLLSQVAINEIINIKDSTIVLEVINDFSNTVGIKNLVVTLDTVTIIKNNVNFYLVPKTIDTISINTKKYIGKINKVEIELDTDIGVIHTSFNGVILKGESTGRYPDSFGDFIIYDRYHITINRKNHNPGILMKKTSITRFSPRDSSPNAALYYNNYYWIFGGWDYNPDSDSFSSKSNIWKSKDALQWELVNPNPPFSHYSGFFVYKNKMFIYRYGSDSVFITNDGLNWVKEKLQDGYNFAEARYVVYKDKAYTFRSNRIGISDDGIRWNFYKTNIDTDTTRILSAFVVGDNCLWMYGGFGGFNDVWTSKDGIFWTKVLNQAPWCKRKWFNYTYFDNKLWIMNGNSEDTSDTINFGNLNDFWYSSDGVNWNKLDTDSTFANRHASFLWNDNCNVLISSGFGNNSVSRMYNDVWVLKPTFTLESNKETKNQEVCINTNIEEIQYDFIGGEDVNITGLPDGIKGLIIGNRININGTPVNSGFFNYQISINGEYNLPTLEGSIRVNPDVKVTLATGTSSQELCIETDIQEVSYLIENSTGVFVTGLPQGVESGYADGVLRIYGSPKESGSFVYEVQINGRCKVSKESGMLKVNDNTSIKLISENWSDNQIIKLYDDSIKTIIYEVENGDALVNNLPDGLSSSFNFNILTIHGKPTRLGEYIYEIETHGKCSAPKIYGKIYVINNMIFPNPTFDNINIVKKSKFKIKVFNSSGMLLFYSDTLETEDFYTLRLKGIVNSPGIYFIELDDLNKNVSSVNKILFIN
ncbi:MAG: T9SS type A sorting domain-containing protein [Bacteroidetes bacterium]|nr:MAG: T9SS type A sorting domain-containing protein [Bacteroidota bacterium]